MTVSQQFHQLAMFATPAEIGEWQSGDYAGRPMSEARHLVRSSPIQRMVHGTSPKTQSELQTHSAGEYLDSLAKSADEQGGIEEPVTISLGTESGRTTQNLQDGHHRATVAMETNRLLPVTYRERGYR